MGTTGHKPSTGVYIGFALSVGAAVLLWIVYIAALNLDVPVSGTFIAALILITLNALLYIVLTPTRFSPFYAWADWYSRRTDTMIYRAAVDAYRALDAAPYDSERAELEDRVRHLRTVVCILNHWDENTEADTGGLADQLIIAHWERFADPQPQDHNPRRT